MLRLVLPFCLIWSSAFAIGKIGLADSPPLLFLGFRFLAAGAILCGIAWMRGQLRGLTLREVSWLALLGILNNALYLGLSFSGMTSVSSGLTSIIIAANPVLTAALAVPVLRERLHGRAVVGLLLGVAGVALIVRGRLNGGADDPGGLLLVFGALLSLVLGTLMFKKAALSVPLLVSSGVQVMVAGLVMLPVALALEDLSAVHVTPSFLASFVWMVVGVSIGGYVLWFAMLHRASAAAATAWHFTLPPLGLLFGWLLLGEAVNPWDLIGILPVALGIALVTRKPARTSA